MKKYQRIMAPTKNRISPKPVWNSLEVTKLFMAALTPLVVLAVGAYLSAQSADLAARRAEQDKANARFAAVVDKRAAVWDQMGPLVGKLQAYNDDVGDGVLIGSVDVVQAHAARGTIDALVVLSQTYNPYFSRDFNRAMDQFLNRTQTFYGALDSWQMDRARHHSYGLSTQDMLNFKDGIDRDADAVRKQLSVELGVSEGTPAKSQR